MDALISSQSEVFAVRLADGWAVRSIVDDFEVPCDETKIAWLLRNSDFQLVQVQDASEARQSATRLYNSDLTVRNIIEIFDPDLEESEVDEIYRYVNEEMADNVISDYAERQLYWNELAVDQHWSKLSGISEKFPRLRRFVHRWRELAPAIACVRRAFENLEDAFFEGTGSKTQTARNKFRDAAIDAGSFRDLAVALYDGRSLIPFSSDTNGTSLPLPPTVSSALALAWGSAASHLLNMTNLTAAGHPLDPPEKGVDLRAHTNAEAVIASENSAKALGEIGAGSTSGNSAIGRFKVTPLSSGSGLQLGNALRRTLLAELPGWAVVAVQIDGVSVGSQDYSVIAGVREDISDVILNIRGIALVVDGHSPKHLRLSKQGPGLVIAGDIELTTGVRIANPGLIICSLNDGAKINVQLIADSGKGYRSAQRNYTAELPPGFFPIDSTFSPIHRAAYKVENILSVEGRTHDELLLTIVTNGAVSPDEALNQAFRIVQERSDGGTELEPELDNHLLYAAPERLNKALLIRVADLKLSVRSASCLQNEEIVFVGNLVQKTEATMLRIPNLGRKSLNEIKDVLSEMGLEFGMKIVDWPPTELMELVKQYENQK